MKAVCSTAQLIFILASVAPAFAEPSALTPLNELEVKCRKSGPVIMGEHPCDDSGGRPGFFSRIEKMVDNELITQISSTYEGGLPNSAGGSSLLTGVPVCNITQNETEKNWLPAPQNSCGGWCNVKFRNGQFVIDDKVGNCELVYAWLRGANVQFMFYHRQRVFSEFRKQLITLVDMDGVRPIAYDAADINITQNERNAMRSKIVESYGSEDKAADLDCPKVGRKPVPGKPAADGPASHGACLMTMANMSLEYLWAKFLSSEIHWRALKTFNEQIGDPDKWVGKVKDAAVARCSSIPFPSCAPLDRNCKPFDFTKNLSQCHRREATRVIKQLLEDFQAPPLPLRASKKQQTSNTGPDVKRPRASLLSVFVSLFEIKPARASNPIDWIAKNWNFNDSVLDCAPCSPSKGKRKGCMYKQCMKQLYLCAYTREGDQSHKRGDSVDPHMDTDSSFAPSKGTNGNLINFGNNNSGIVCVTGANVDTSVSNYQKLHTDPTKSEILAKLMAGTAPVTDDDVIKEQENSPEFKACKNEKCGATTSSGGVCSTNTGGGDVIVGNTDEECVQQCAHRICGNTVKCTAKCSKPCVSDCVQMSAAQIASCKEGCKDDSKAAEAADYDLENSRGELGTKRVGEMDSWFAAQGLKTSPLSDVQTRCRDIAGLPMFMIPYSEDFFLSTPEIPGAGNEMADDMIDPWPEVFPRPAGMWLSNKDRKKYRSSIDELAQANGAVVRDDSCPGDPPSPHAGPPNEGTGGHIADSANTALADARGVFGGAGAMANGKPMTKPGDKASNAATAAMKPLAGKAGPASKDDKGGAGGLAPHAAGKTADGYVSQMTGAGGGGMGGTVGGGEATGEDKDVSTGDAVVGSATGFEGAGAGGAGRKGDSKGGGDAMAGLLSGLLGGGKDGAQGNGGVNAVKFGDDDYLNKANLSLFEIVNHRMDKFGLELYREKQFSK